MQNWKLGVWLEKCFISVGLRGTIWQEQFQIWARYIIWLLCKYKHAQLANYIVPLIVPNKLTRCISDLKAPGEQPADRADSSIAGNSSKASRIVSGLNMQRISTHTSYCYIILIRLQSCQLDLLQLSSSAIFVLFNFTGLCRITIYRASFQATSRTEWALHSSEWSRAFHFFSLWKSNVVF